MTAGLLVVIAHDEVVRHTGHSREPAEAQERLVLLTRWYRDRMHGAIVAFAQVLVTLVMAESGPTAGGDGERCSCMKS